jgi:phospholipase/carboxylesterase
MVRGGQREAVSRAAGRVHLYARPGRTAGEAPTGLQSLGFDVERDGLLYVPTSYRVDRPSPLVLTLHGAGGTAQHGLAPLLDLADQSGLILVAPGSREETWDVIVHDYGPDINFIDWALAQTFERYAVDSARVAVGGFSDGASYALSIGVANGDLFTHVIAFSPGFIAPTRQQGSPRIFISHGTKDRVLAIDRCSRRIVPQLESAGFEVRYHEFDGGHTVPREIALEAVSWFTAGGRGLAP